MAHGQSAANPKNFVSLILLLRKGLCSSLHDITVCIVPLVLADLAGLPFFIAQNKDWEEAKPFADKEGHEEILQQ